MMARLLIAAVFLVPALPLMPGAVKDWRNVRSARDTRAMERQAAAMAALTRGGQR